MNSRELRIVLEQLENGYKQIFKIYKKEDVDGVIVHRECDFKLSIGLDKEKIIEVS